MKVIGQGITVASAVVLIAATTASAAFTWDITCDNAASERTMGWQECGSIFGNSAVSDRGYLVGGSRSFADTDSGTNCKGMGGFLDSSGNLQWGDDQRGRQLVSSYPGRGAAGSDLPAPPVPAAAWYFALSIICLIGLKRKN